MTVLLQKPQVYLLCLAIIIESGSTLPVSKLYIYWYVLRADDPWSTIDKDRLAVKVWFKLLRELALFFIFLAWMAYDFRVLYAPSSSESESSFFLLRS